MKSYPDSVWFRHIAAEQDSPGNLIWFSHAGGTTAQLVRQTLRCKPGIDIWAAVLPGREERWQEPIADDLNALVAELDRAMGPLPGEKTVLAGHSFGALLAYLVSLARCRSGNPPRAMMVMGMSPPDCLDYSHRWSEATDEDLIEHLDRRYGGIPAVLRDDEAALRYLLPAVRGDLRLLESYQHQRAEPLALQMIATGGIDDPTVDRTELAGWRRFTSGAFALQMYSGNHFFPYANLPALTQLAESALRASKSA